VKVATSDMIHGYRSALGESFPETVVTVDKFHVVKNCSDAVDNTRKREMRSKNAAKTKDLKKTRYIWLKNPDNLTDRQRERLGQLLQVEYLDTVQAYSCRLELQDFYETHKAYDEDMVSDFERLAIRFANSAVMEIRKFAQCLTRNAVEILNYFQTLRTNAILERFDMARRSPFSSELMRNVVFSVDGRTLSWAMEFRSRDERSEPRFFLVNDLGDSASVGFKKKLIYNQQIPGSKEVISRWIGDFTDIELFSLKKVLDANFVMIVVDAANEVHGTITMKDLFSPNGMYQRLLVCQMSETRRQELYDAIHGLLAP
jgi:hypothetical protein